MENEELEIITHSKGTMASFAFGTFLNEFLWMAFSAFAFFFYEAEVGLNIVLVGIAFVIYAVWNAVNDPLIGYLTNRPFKFTKRWGRRFPWILIGGLLWTISYFLLFAPPDIDPVAGEWILFGWLVFALCLFDTFCSLFWVNYTSLTPDKFRSPEERRTSNGMNIVIGSLGTVSGAIVPPLFIIFGVKFTYIISAGVVFLIAIIALTISLPGSRDEEEYVDRYLENYEEQSDKTSFFKTLKTSMKQKNFVAYVIVLLTYQVMARSMTASIPYIARYVLVVEATVITIIMGSLLLALIISTPFWVKYAQKSNNNRKVILITGFLLVIVTIPLIFVNTIEGFIIGMILWGSAMGGFWAMQTICLTDIIDEAVVDTCERQEGTYNGISMFFSRLAIAVQAVSFALVHELTGFVEGSDTQSTQAIIGIKIHFAVIPLFVLLIGMLIFYKLYDLTPEKTKENQIKLKKMCI
ncbi:MAG: MFS transporter [Promethearchaeota archaeon]|nr:MAG: MFS transporter [Candidatus Lokiarchaeota archaeon]